MEKDDRYSGRGREEGDRCARGGHEETVEEMPQPARFQLEIVHESSVQRRHDVHEYEGGRREEAHERFVTEVLFLVEAVEHQFDAHGEEQHAHGQRGLKLHPQVAQTTRTCQHVLVRLALLLRLQE